MNTREAPPAIRWPALVLIPALLAALWLAAAGATDDDPVADAPGSLVLGPLVAGEEAFGSFAFCAGGTGTAGSVAEHTVVLVNTTDEERLATVEVFGSRGEDGPRPEPQQFPVPVAPYARVSVALGTTVAAPYVSAMVELDGGGVLVEHTISGPLGSARAPCATNASESWYVPVGATDHAGEDALSRELLVFFNPFPADAVLDVTFSTEDGGRTPEDFVGFVVPGRGVVGVDLAGARTPVTLSDEVATSVVARTGRVVVDRIQIYNNPTGKDGPARSGVALSSGVPTAAEAWVFPAGEVSAIRAEELFLYNPSSETAEVDVEIRTARSGEAGSEPFELTIRPNRHLRLDLVTEERMAAIRTTEPPTPYTVVVRSADGVPMAVERLVAVTPGQPGAGFAISTGSALAGLRLLADLDGAEAGSSLVLFNPSTETIAQVRISVIDTVARRVREPTGAATYDLAPGARRAIAIEALGSGAITVVVESTVPIMGERDVVASGDRFIAIAVPGAAGAAPAQLSIFDDLGG